MSRGLKELGKRFESFIGLGIGYEVADKYGRKWIRSPNAIFLRYVDVDILTVCHEQGFMTEEQIERMFSPGGERGARPVLMRRQLMNRMGFLREVKLKGSKTPFYMTTREGRKLLMEVHCSDSVEVLPAVDETFFHYSEHALMVSEVRIALARRAGISEWTCKRLLRRSEPRIVVPDGLAHRGKKTWVIKLELSLKTAAYYRAYFAKLLSAYPSAEAILFVVCDEKRLEWLMRQAAPWKKVYFISMNQLLKPQEGTPEDRLEFTNAQDEKYLLCKMDEKFLFDQGEGF